MLDRIKKVVTRGILADQSGQDTLEYVAIAGTILLVLLAIFAIISSIAIRGWCRQKIPEKKGWGA